MGVCEYYIHGDKPLFCFLLCMAGFFEAMYTKNEFMFDAKNGFLKISPYNDKSGKLDSHSK